MTRRSHTSSSHFPSFSLFLFPLYNFFLLYLFSLSLLFIYFSFIFLFFLFIFLIFSFISPFPFLFPSLSSFHLHHSWSRVWVEGGAHRWRGRWRGASLVKIGQLREKFGNLDRIASETTFLLEHKIWVQFC